jgi:hypothetical protein
VVGVSLAVDQNYDPEDSLAAVLRGLGNEYRTGIAGLIGGLQFVYQDLGEASLMDEKRV